ncbi:MAG: gluconate 2-dehydrogenase subunit 3 family protein [Acidobacteria bacterium]|nr:gluconate 2-dehydrogenase subunit 3 family protein [Acidobacteriota bacterium]
MNSRRELIQIGAAAAAVAQEHHEVPGTPPAKKAVRYFKPAEMELLARIVETILPASDTPGAAAAGVHFYVDWQAFTNKNLGARLRRDLAWVRGQKFLTGDAVALLTAWSRSTGEPKRIFTQFKDLTIDGYYGTREGLQVELGWNANTFLREFKGCTHNEDA